MWLLLLLLRERGRGASGARVAEAWTTGIWARDGDDGRERDGDQGSGFLLATACTSTLFLAKTRTIPLRLFQVDLLVV